MKLLKRLFGKRLGISGRQEKKLILDLKQELLNKSGAEQFERLRTLGISIPVVSF